MGLTDTLRAPIGPLPAWGWGVVVVGGVVAYTVVKGRGSGSGNTDTQNQFQPGLGVSGPLSGDGNGGWDQQTITTTVMGWPKAVADRFKTLASNVRHYQDTVARLKARIAQLKKIPIGRRTAAQKRELAHDLAALKTNQAALTAAQKELTTYEAGLTSGTDGVYVGPTTTTSNQTLAPSLAADVTQRAVTIDGRTYLPALTNQSV